MDTAKTTRMKDAVDLKSTERVERFRAFLNNQRGLIVGALLVGAAAAVAGGGYFLYQKNKKGELYTSFYDAGSKVIASSPAQDK